MLEVNFLLTLPMAEFRIFPPQRPCKDTMIVQQGGDLLSSKKLVEAEVVLGGQDRLWQGGFVFKLVHALSEMAAVQAS